ncbi:MAG: hypothetical protein F9K18_09840, partial [Thermoanaerobaculia bacterium]
MSQRVAFVLRSPVSISTLLLAVAALSAPGRARADFLPSPLDLHREIHRDVRGLLRELAHVPLAIHHQHLRDLEIFLDGRSYYGPHRHYHDTYAFPVWVGESVVYQPYAYCGGRLFAPPRVRPTLWYEWGSPRAGQWCSHHRAYYPTRHSCFHGSVQRRIYDRGRTGDWDRGHRRYERRDWDRGRGYDRRDWERGRGYDRRDRDRRRGDDDRGRGRGHE